MIVKHIKVKHLRRSVECTKRYIYSRENTYVKKYFENFTNWLQFLTMCNNFNESHRIRSIYSLQTIAVIWVIQIEHFDDDGSSECDC